MRSFLVSACFCACWGASAQASILPTIHLEARTVQAFQDYLNRFDKEVEAPFAESGKMWMDGASCCMSNKIFQAGRPVLESRQNADIAGGSIHHYSGAIHIAGANIADVRRIMQDYGNYPKYFKPDVVKGSGKAAADSTPENEHYTSNITMEESTVWMSVSYDCVYDTHFRRYDPHRWESRSRAVSIKEWNDPKDASHGTMPEGDDHGLLWKTNTYWFVREANGGVDVQLDSITLSRPIPMGFGWWGTKRTREAVNKMLLDLRTVLETSH